MSSYLTLYASTMPKAKPKGRRTTSSGTHQMKGVPLPMATKRRGYTLPGVAEARNSSVHIVKDVKYADPHVYPIAQVPAVDPSVHSLCMELRVQNKKYVVLTLMKTAKSEPMESSGLAKFNFVENDKYEFEVCSSVSCGFVGSNSSRSISSENLGGSNSGDSPYKVMSVFAFFMGYG